MEASARAEDFVPAALAAMGVEADEVELAVMNAARNLFWPPLLELLALDTGPDDVERCTDLSRAPELP